MQLINQPSPQELLNRRNAASNPNIFSVRSSGSTLQCSVNPVRHKVKRSATLHRKSCPRVMRQNKNIGVIRRLLAPPTLPAFVGPGAAHGPKHIPAKNPRSDILEAANGKIVVDSRRPAVLAGHALESARWKKPAMQPHPATPSG